MAAINNTFQVWELAEHLKELLEGSLPSVWVEGEVSNFSKPASGHWYFTLKDSKAQLRCAMFKNRNFYVRPQPKDGDKVRVRALVSLYTGRGELQLIAEAMEPAGTGALLAALEALKQQLAAEGLFSRKRPLPALPQHIGVITSATGAAIQDIKTTLARRFPLAPVTLWPVPVQGAEAPAAIALALRQLPERAAVDVILLARGGGSLEDLLAFSDASVVRAVAACAVPVVCGVGHEVDFSLADFAADHRAATPTAAAEAATPNAVALLDGLRQQGGRLSSALRQRLAQASEQLNTLHRRLRLQNPARRLQQQAQRLDELATRLHASAPRHHIQLALRLQALAKRLGPPQGQLRTGRAQWQALAQRLQQAPQQQLGRYDSRVQQAQASLKALSPYAVLGRGYAVVRSADGQLLRSALALHPGQPLALQFADGRAHATVTTTEPHA